MRDLYWFTRKKTMLRSADEDIPVRQLIPKIIRHCKCAAQTGKMVRIDVGYDGLVLRWFTGYVERSQPADNGTCRLFVRELVGIFDKLWPCSFQHPTLRQITDWISEQSGLTVTTPVGAAYADKPIPHFTHSGTGYQLLASVICLCPRSNKPPTARVQLQHDIAVNQMDRISGKVQAFNWFHRLITPAHR